MNSLPHAFDTRRRDTILAALEVFRKECDSRNLTSLLQFLYVSENEGLNVSELAHVTGTSISVTARTAKLLAGELGRKPRGGQRAQLFELRGADDDKRLRFVHLTEHGRSLREKLDTLIEQAIPIVPRP